MYVVLIRNIFKVFQDFSICLYYNLWDYGQVTLFHWTIIPHIRKINEMYVKCPVQSLGNSENLINNCVYFSSLLFSFSIFPSGTTCIPMKRVAGCLGYWTLDTLGFTFQMSIQLLCKSISTINDPSPHFLEKLDN